MERKELGVRIKAARKKAGKTQKMLANELGVSQPALNKWESGITFPSVGLSVGLLDQIATALDVSVEHLLCQYGASEIAKPIVLETKTVSTEEFSDNLCLIHLGVLLGNERANREEKKKAIKGELAEGRVTKDEAFDLMDKFV